MLDGVTDVYSTAVVHIPVEVEVEPVTFKVVARGYDPKAVDTHVAALEQELAELRWEREDLAAQHDAVAAQRERQQRWTPTFVTLGDRVEEIIRLAEEEACSLRAAAHTEATKQREQAAAEILAQQREQALTYDKSRQDAQRELRVLTYGAESQRKMLETELVQLRRDAEIDAAKQVAQAKAHAQQIRDEAAREAAAELAAARAEVSKLQGQREELGMQLIELASQLAAVVQRMQTPDERAG
jgi:hypothetical protein